MELKPGFKQTEVGVIPEDWGVRSLRDLLISTQLGGNYKNSEKDSGFPLIKMGNLGRGSIRLDKVEYIDRPQRPVARDRLSFNDVLFNTRNTLDLVGKVSIWRDELPEAYFNSNIMRMVFDDRFIASNPYMNYVLNTPGTLRGLRSIAIGTTSVAAIYGRDLVNVFVPVATKQEQSDVASALSDADALIESLEQLLAKKRQIKQGAMQELLTGKRRLRGFEGEWVFKKFREVASLINGRAYHISEWKTSGVPVVRLQNLTGGNDYYYSDLMLPDRQYCQNGDLLYMWSATFGPYIWKGDKAIFHYHIWKVVPNSNFDSGLVYHILNDITLGLKTTATSGGTMLHLTKNGMEKLEIRIPPRKDEQLALATVLSDMDSEIAALETRLYKARRLKQGMMQELLTGRIRLVRPEAAPRSVSA